MGQSLGARLMYLQFTGLKQFAPCMHNTHDRATLKTNCMLYKQILYL